MIGGRCSRHLARESLPFKVLLREQLSRADSHLMDALQLFDGARTTELAEFLEGCLQAGLELTGSTTGPLAIALCDLGTPPLAVRDRLITTWSAALKETDVVLPVASEGRCIVAVLRHGVQSGVEAEMLVDKLLARAHDPIRIDGASYRVRPYVGIAVSRINEEPEALLQRALAALDRAYGADGRSWDRLPL
jgi:hypothetical protein